MTRLVLVSILFLFSLLILFRAPANLLWYLAILVSEFCWIFFLLLCVLLLWRFGNQVLQVYTNVIAVAALLIYALPVVQAVRLSTRMDSMFTAVFGGDENKSTLLPFRPLQMITGIGAGQLSPTVFMYDEANNLSLDFYSSQRPGIRPCIVVVHGGSWAGGNSRQLPELNSVLAKEGYHVAAINYRLAPKHCFPAPLQDVKAALDFLTANAAKFSIDTTAFTLLGRSAGGQVALSAAYTVNDARINGVINFYGPADMVWGYENPCNPLVLDSRKVMRNYLGGSLKDVPQQYTKSSATETVPTNAPPTLLLYAENDPLVSPRHGARLTRKLDAKGVKSISVYLPWATHAFDYTLNGPGGQLSTWAVKRFLRAVNKQQRLL